MHIGFDAKRLFFNHSGLGNYSRSTVGLLRKYAPQHRYTLFTPREGNRCGFDTDRTEVVRPHGAAALAPSLWRSYGMARAIRRSGVEVYHGLSNELPADIRRSGARSVLTMHDLIFVRMPELYKPADRRIYTAKYGRSCREADRIVAISRQTADDLVNLWHVDPARIEVVYQGCDPIFYEQATDERRKAVGQRYMLPNGYILSVGTIERRKNLMLTVKAMAEGNIDCFLVAVGRHTPYADEVMEYAVRNGIAHRIRMVHDAAFADLPALYQMSSAVVYASLYEGFGIPILEGLNSGVPVITSRGGVFSETGGDACLYVDPHDADQMIDALNRALGDQALRSDLAEKAAGHVLHFREERIAEHLMRVYESVR